MLRAIKSSSTFLIIFDKTMTWVIPSAYSNLSVGLLFLLAPYKHVVVNIMRHEYLQIGIDFIDEDHKRLLRIIQDTKKAIEEYVQKNTLDHQVKSSGTW